MATFYHGQYTMNITLWTLNNHLNISSRNKVSDISLVLIFHNFLTRDTGTVREGESERARESLRYTERSYELKVESFQSSSVRCRLGIQWYNNIKMRIFHRLCHSIYIILFSNNLQVYTQVFTSFWTLIFLTLVSSSEAALYVVYFLINQEWDTKCCVVVWEPGSRGYIFTWSCWKVTAAPSLPLPLLPPPSLLLWCQSQVRASPWDCSPQRELSQFVVCFRSQ